VGFFRKSGTTILQHDDSKVGVSSMSSRRLDHEFSSHSDQHYRIDAPARDVSELESVIAAQARAPNGGLIAMPDSFLNAHRAEATSLAARYRLPAVYAFRQFTEDGGLLSYGNDIVDNYRRAATYVDRILKGANPGELPVQAPVKFELVINLNTARALGLDVPAQLQQRADEVIE
jgi:putative ABC transport system substrate-binding protein